MSYTSHIITLNTCLLCQVGEKAASAGSLIGQRTITLSWKINRDGRCIFDWFASSRRFCHHTCAKCGSVDAGVRQHTDHRCIPRRRSANVPRTESKDGPAAVCHYASSKWVSRQTVSWLGLLFFILLSRPQARNLNFGNLTKYYPCKL